MSYEHVEAPSGPAIVPLWDEQDLAHHVWASRMIAYRRSECGPSTPKDACPFKAPERERTKAALALLAAQLHWRRVSLPAVDLRGVDFTRVRDPYRHSAVAEPSIPGKLPAYHEVAGPPATDLDRASFRKADLRRSVFDGLSMAQARLSETSLAGASFVGTRLSRADLRKADVAGTRFDGADLSGADLSGCLGLTDAQLNLAKGDLDTVIDSALTRPAHWTEAR